jgi:hypothetical protein
MLCPIALRLPPCTIDAILKTRSMDADDGVTNGLKFEYPTYGRFTANAS